MGFTKEESSTTKGFITLRGQAPSKRSALDTSRCDIVWTTDNTCSCIDTYAGTEVASSAEHSSKRVNYINIQMSHALAAEGATIPAVRTGEETMIARKVPSMWAVCAQHSGVVKSIGDTAVTVEYDGNRVDHYEIGRKFGSSAGITTPQNLMCNVRVGQKLKVGDVIVYNSGFFAPDPLNPGNVVMKQGVLSRVALTEAPLTYEDSSMIFPTLSKKLRISKTVIQTVISPFDRKVRVMVSPGDEVNARQALCIVESPTAAAAGVFSAEAYDSLRRLRSKSPRATRSGKVEKIEVLYRGDIKEMSSSLRDIAKEYDKELANRLRSLGKPVFTGEVDDGYRINGNPLALNTIAIRFYITHTEEAGTSDKGVYAHQMKSVFGAVVNKQWMTESGKPLDAIQSGKSILDRIVLSEPIIGVASAILEKTTQDILEIWHKD